MRTKSDSLLKARRVLSLAAAMLFAVPGLMLAQQVLAPTNFGSQSVGASSGPQTLTFTGMPTQVSIEPGSTDFSESATCNGSGTCNVVVTFTPKHPGLIQSAIYAFNQTQGNQFGQVVGIAPVYGIGLSPQIATGPGVMSTVANRASSILSSAVLNGVALGPGARVYMSDTATNSLYVLNPTTEQVSLYPTNNSGAFHSPSALAFDAETNLYVADTANNAVLEVVAATGAIVTVAGTGAAGNGGDGGPATSAQLNGPLGVALDAQGNLYVADSGNNRVREVMATSGQITSSSTIVNFAGSSAGTAGFSGDGGAATSATLNNPVGLAIDSAGNVYIADSNNEVIRKVSGGNISTVAGTGTSAGYSGDNGPATSAQLHTPWSVAVDAGGSLYIADKANDVIRKVTGDPSHIITTIAGQAGAAGYIGDGGAATSAKLNAPSYVALDATGNLFIVDSGNNAIREVLASAASLSFPPTANGSSSGPITLTVSNTGDENLQFTGLSVSAPYSQTGGTCSASFALAPGASCTIQVTFSPTSSSGTSGSVVITANSLNQSGTQSSIGLAESTGWRFVPIVPCRAVDTRVNDSFSGSFLTAGSSRDYVLPNNTLGCTDIPATALAYSLNVTVVPHGSLRFLTLWQRGQTRPIVSILNSLDGRVKANGAIIPADTSGGISVYTTDPTDLVLDVDGYFVPSSASQYSAALEFYPLTPCRVADTRNANGPLGGPFITNHTSRDFPVLSSPCSANVPSNVAAYSLNVTAVPRNGQPVIYLTAWPTGQTQPTASVLNAVTGTVVANGAIIPAGSSGDVSVYASNDSDVVLDINGYFAAPGTSGLSLYSLTACRVLDTRLPTGAAPFSGTITVPVVGSSCSVPSAAQAYVFNATVVPTSSLAYITLWPAGTAQQLQSTLNAVDQSITSNLAIVPTINGSVSAYASSSTFLILDIFGYFAP